MSHIDAEAITLKVYLEDTDARSLNQIEWHVFSQMMHMSRIIPVLSALFRP